MNSCTKLQYVGNSAESFKNGKSVDLKETCGMKDIDTLRIIDSESTEFSEEWFIKRIIGNINHLLCDDVECYTFQYHTVLEIGMIYNSKKDIYYIFTSLK